MYGIIGCSGCNSKRMIDLSDGVTVCPRCGRKMDTKRAAILFSDEDQKVVRSVFSTMTGFASEDDPLPDFKDPMDLLAFKVKHTSDVGLKLSTICDGLSEIKGTFTLDDVEQLVPGKGEKFVKIMLEECMIYEVSLGKYKK